MIGSSPAHCVPLHTLVPGELARVGFLSGSHECVRRLCELGFCDGASVRMVQSGSPCIVEVAGAKLCFRDCESCNIFVHASC